MYVVIALVVDQTASTAPTAVTATPVDGWRSRRWRLPPRRLVASPGITVEKCRMTVVIVSGPTTSVKAPSTTSRVAGMAKNVE